MCLICVFFFFFYVVKYLLFLDNNNTFKFFNFLPTATHILVNVRGSSNSKKLKEDDNG